MGFVTSVEKKHRNARGIGRRSEDRALRGAGWAAGRERRHPVPRTDAAAHSVIMAQLAAKPILNEKAEAAALYAAVRPQKSKAELEKEAFLREAELAHQAAQKAWVFERRTGHKPRSTEIEDAEFHDI